MGQKKKLMISLLVTLGLVGFIILIASFPTIFMLIALCGLFFMVWYCVYIVLFEIILD